MVDRSDSILWQRMATEEMRREARRRGMKLSDLEEERALSVALQESATIGHPHTIATTASAQTSHHSTTVNNGNSTVLSPSIPTFTDTPSLNKSEQTRRSEEGNTDDDDYAFLPDHDQLSTIETPTTTTATTAVITDTVIDITSTTTTELSIWQTSLPLEITNKVVIFIHP